MVAGGDKGNYWFHKWCHSCYWWCLSLCCYFRATVRIILHSNTAINILIYSMRLRDFREAIKTNIRNCFRGCGCLSISTRMWYFLGLHSIRFLCEECCNKIILTTSRHENTFPVTGPLRGDISYQWIPFTKGQECAAFMFSLLASWWRPCVCRKMCQPSFQRIPLWRQWCHVGVHRCTSGT